LPLDAARFKENCFCVEFISTDFPSAATEVKRVLGFLPVRQGRVRRSVRAGDRDFSMFPKPKTCNPLVKK
jgi:hypothetical protein